MMLFKVLSEDGRPCNGGTGEWSLPTQNTDGIWTPGEWMPPIEGLLIPCQCGYHLCREKDLLTWFNARIYEAEYRGEMIECNDKIVCREARLLRRMNWDAKIARLFACWCVRNTPLADGRKVWDLLTDDRSRNAVVVAERYANGEASNEELTTALDAAGAAAWATARYAAWATALDAARAAARYTARSAAWDAARVAAWAAARYAALDAARAAQMEELLRVIDAKGA